MLSRIPPLVDSTPACAQALETVTALARLTRSAVHVAHLVPSVAVSGTILPRDADHEDREARVESLKTLLDSGIKADGEVPRTAMHSRRRSDAPNTVWPKRARSRQRPEDH
ncbi:hypothetical protein ACWGQ5_45280 [Streptomyces sp. NPDC055722]